MTFTVAVTRPEPQCSQTAARLEKIGYQVRSAPLLVAKDVGDWGPADNIGSLAITSRTAAMRLAHHPQFHTIPTFCVGKASAADARRSGALHVESADGDVETLFALLCEKAKPPIVHVGGEDQKGDLAGRLMEAGWAAERRVIYKMAPSEALPSVEGPLDAVLLYSPRTAKIFTRYATHSPWREAACVVLSTAVAAPVRSTTVCKVAERPNEEALFKALAALRDGG
ncbi:MAG: uroporphyrinogen-III synthase [Pseudomonadota bacterium]